MAIFKNSEVPAKGDKEYNRLVGTALDETAVKVINAVDAASVLFDPSDSQPTYIGINQDADALSSATDWVIFKFLYSGSATVSIRRKVGAWDNRASLF